MTFKSMNHNDARSDLQGLARVTVSASDKILLSNTATILSDEPLYRGLRIQNIRTFELSELSGAAGVYLTFDRARGEHYALDGPMNRYKESLEWMLKPPILYSCNAAGTKLVDMCEHESKNYPILDEGFKTFVELLAEFHRSPALASLDRKWRALEGKLIADNLELRALSKKLHRGSLFVMTQGVANGLVAEYLIALGFDGILDADKNVLIFLPEKITILKEENLEFSPSSPYRVAKRE